MVERGGFRDCVLDSSGVYLGYTWQRLCREEQGVIIKAIASFVRDND